MMRADTTRTEMAASSKGEENFDVLCVAASRPAGLDVR